MERENRQIRSIGAGLMDTLMAYLKDQLKDNGRNGVALFQPQSREAVWLGSEKAAAFREGLDTNVGASNWRRAWGAFDVDGSIIGHVDLRARPEPCTSHRALLGVGVHRDHRSSGLGRALIEHAIRWAVQDTDVEWIDLDFLGGNLPAERLYRSMGFHEVATISDMFRIDGDSVSNVLMTIRIRSTPTSL